MLRFLQLCSVLFLIQCTSELQNASKPTEDCICMEIYQPVCGENGEEYPNSCYADCAKVSYTDGPCPQSQKGIIRFLGDPAIDGCGWVIALEEDRTTRNKRAKMLDAEFKKDELEVELTYRKTEDVSPCGRGSQIPIIDILSIKKIG